MRLSLKSSEPEDKGLTAASCEERALVDVESMIEHLQRDDDEEGGYLTSAAMSSSSNPSIIIGNGTSISGPNQIRRPNRFVLERGAASPPDSRKYPYPHYMVAIHCLW